MLLVRHCKAYCLLTLAATSTIALSTACVACAVKTIVLTWCSMNLMSSHFCKRRMPSLAVQPLVPMVPRQEYRQLGVNPLNQGADP